MLTNAQAANAYIGAVRRRLVELLFDANEEAEKGLAFGIKQQAEAIKKQLAEITMTPEAAFVDPLLGTWTNPRLGTIEFRREGTGVTLDVGEWKSTVGEHKDQSGVRRLISHRAALCGLRVLAADDRREADAPVRDRAAEVRVRADAGLSR